MQVLGLRTGHDLRLGLEQSVVAWKCSRLDATLVTRADGPLEAPADGAWRLPFEGLIPDPWPLEKSASYSSSGSPF